MTGRERLGVLRGVVELADASDAELRSLLPFFDEVCVPAGVVLAREGRLGHELFVVATGEVEVCRQGRATGLRPGESFGWTAMRARGAYDATAVTMSAACLLVMSHAQFGAAEALAVSRVRPVGYSLTQTSNRARGRPVEPA
jgi:CRP-like cAMP-binding protein